MWARGDFLPTYANRDLRAPEAALIERHRATLSGRVLELGCGAGRLIGHLIEVAAEVHGVDISPAMIDYCTRTYPQATFSVADLRDLSEFTVGSYGAVLAPFNVLDVLGDSERRRVLGELARILRPGGLLMLTSDNLAFAPLIARPTHVPVPWRWDEQGLREFAWGIKQIPRRIRIGGGCSQCSEKSPITRFSSTRHTTTPCCTATSAVTPRSTSWPRPGSSCSNAWTLTAGSFRRAPTRRLLRAPVRRGPARRRGPLRRALISATGGRPPTAATDYIEEMREVMPRVFHWTAIHPKIHIEVSSYWLEEAGVLFDPLVPVQEGLDWFAGRPVAPQAILLSNRHHYRESGRFAERFGCTIHCNRAGLHEFSHGEVVEGFDIGETLPGGVLACEFGAICPDDTALHILEKRAVVLADGVVRGGPYGRSGPLGFVPDALMDDPPATKRAILAMCTRLLAGRDFDHLLLAHGGPVIGEGRALLQDLVDSGGRTAFEM